MATWQSLSPTAVVPGRRAICEFFQVTHVLDVSLTLGRGFFGHGEMQKEFEDAAFGLQPGQVSSVIETASGVHLIER